MRNSKTNILQKVQQGELTVEQAVELLADLKLQKLANSDPQDQNPDLQTLYLAPSWIWQSADEQNVDILFDQNQVVLVIDVDEQRFHQLEEISWFRNCVLVQFGSGYEKKGINHYQVNQRSPHDFERLISALQTDNLLPSYVLHWLSSQSFANQIDTQTVQEELNNSIIPVFLLSQAILQTPANHKVDIISIYDRDATTATPNTIASFGRVAHLESSRLRFRTICIDTQYPSIKLELQAIMSAALQVTQPVEELRIDSQRGYWRQSLNEIEISDRYAKTSSSLIRPGGVYLITGGMGGLGLIVARHLAQISEVRLILIGRSQFSEKHLKAIQELESYGAKAAYFSADVTQQHEMNAIIQSVRNKYGAINGVIHTAGIIEDKLIRNKELSSFERVLAPKVLGTVILDSLTQADRLDFFITFSSIGSLLPQVGQADYASANRFMDEFAVKRQILVDNGQRFGHSLSINWPLWQDGNMKIPAEQSEFLKHQVGLVAMPTNEGLTGLEKALASDKYQVFILYGNSEKLRKTLTKLFTPALNVPLVEKTISQLDIDTLKEKLTKYIINLVAETSKFPIHQIDPSADLETIGLDSILVNKINFNLETAFGYLPKTLLYEYQSIEALVDYFVENHLASITSFFQNNSSRSNNISEPNGNGKKVLTKENQVENINNKKSNAIENLPFQTFTKSDDIAIIGIHGRYPQADNLEALWENLKSGRDSITTIPKERWNHSLFYDQNRQRKGISYGKWGGFLEDVDKFDPLFFNISPREAETMDPQERLFLEVAWSALEDAGYTRKTLTETAEISKKQVGVFVGVTFGQYQLFSIEGWSKGQFQPAYSSFWSIANRVSYILDLNGPSLAIDTACSSSLTAIHLACESLRKGECAYAIAGGVNLNLHPSKYLALSDMQFLSSDGRCRSFGEGGDGYVPGEGVGAIILKPLNQAIKDGDRIYALIKGTAINHGGKTNGYTVPNPQAQADVIKQTFEKARIDPQTVNYIEAHGTGTSLGDPIEIAGLSKVFNGNQNLQYCGIGSIKSNIGHLESAAGIASLTKIILQLQHQTLVPSLHANQLNSNIDFVNSPFYVCQSLKIWEPAVVETAERTKQTYPRRAAVSSFGAGGSNAHAIVEEYIPEAVQQSKDLPSLTTAEMIVLSARDHQSIYAYAEKLLAYLQKHTPCLSDLAYTLQVGREAFEVRLGLLVHSQQELIEKLSAFLKQQSDSLIFSGNHEFKTNIEIQNQQIPMQLWQEKRWTELLKYWVAGGNVPWKTFYNLGDRQRISLPTYPFNRQRYWVPVGYNLPVQTHHHQALHPLIDRIIPSFDGVVFAKVLKSEDRLIAEHYVRGSGFLPGVAHLEMVKAASKMVSDCFASGFENVVWISPIQVDNEQPIRLTLKKKNQHQLQFEITLDNTEQRQICSQGLVTLLEQETLNYNRVSLPNLNLEEIKLRCTKNISASEIYTLYERIGLSYGSYFQRLETLWHNDIEVLGKLSLDGLPIDDFQLYELHPALLDGALHSLAAFFNHKSDFCSKTMIPFSVSRVDIFGSIEQCRYVYGRLLGEQSPDSAQFDVILIDEKGQPLIHLHEFCTRRLNASNQIAVVPNSIEQHLFYRPIWQEKVSISLPSLTESQQGQVLICGHSNDLGLSAELIKYFGVERAIMVDLKQHHSIAEFEQILNQISHLTSIYFLGGIQGKYYNTTDINLLDRIQEIGVIALWRLLKAMANQGKDAVHLRVITNNLYPVLAEDRVFNVFSGALDGLARVAAREFRHLQLTCLDITKEDVSNLINPSQWNNFIKRLEHEKGQSNLLATAWRSDRCFLRRLQAIDLDEFTRENLPFRTQGTYLLIGGAGGLGLEISEYLAKNFQARLVLVGRSQLKEDRKRRLAQMEEYGAKVTYHQADACSEVEMQAVVQQTIQQYGSIHGAIHTAIVLQDSAIVTMDEATLRASMAPKIKGSVVLNAVLETEPLDFIAFFSSAISLTAAAGQSNYAAGCTFKDSFAQMLRTRKQRFVRVINWGYWGDTGIVATPAYQERMTKIGVESLSVLEGIEAFEKIMAGSADQVMAVKMHSRHLQELGVDFEQRFTALPSATNSFIEVAYQGSQRFQEQVAQMKKDLGETTAIQLEIVSQHYLLKVLQQMGVLRHPGDSYNIQELQSALGIISDYNHLYQACLKILEKAGFIEIESGIIRAKDSVRLINSDLVNQIISQLTRSYPETEVYLTLIERCLNAYPEVLTGKLPHIDVLFPGGSTTLLDKIYAGNRRADYFNELLSQGIAAVIEHKISLKETVRILEVGAGTGGTTTTLLKSIAQFGSHISYTITDISPKLVNLGSSRFSDDYPFTQYQVFDVEKDVIAQGFQVGYYDIILATNVLHATQNIRLTLSNLKRLLKTNGLLVINELTQVWDFATLTFGLTSGWWLSEDKEIRQPNSPLLKPQRWQQVLEDIGFQAVKIVGSPKIAVEQMDQCIILAESDGWIAEKFKHNDPFRESINSDTSHNFAQSTPPKLFTQTPTPSTNSPVEKSISIDYITQIVALVLKMNPADLEPDVPFERYGVDSLVAMDIINRLEDDFGSLRKDLLFNYPTVEELANYLSDKTRSKLIDLKSDRLSTVVTDNTKKSQYADIKTNPKDFEQPQSDSAVPEPIAIIGLSGRFPGAANVQTFWENLKSGQCAITEIPPERWNHDLYYDSTSQNPGTSYSKWGAFLEDIDRFEPLFFNIAPRDAEQIDPQERLFLETAWATVEDAGYTRATLNNYAEAANGTGVGVFVGVMYGAYQLLAAEQWGQGNRINAHSAYWSIANRVSHVMDFHGPSMAIDTACSSSLTAIHLACESIRRRECRAAIAGGVNLIVHPSHQVALSKMQMLSHGPHCRAFAEDADGFVPGEGVGAVLLKPLSDAIRDRDRIYGVIRTSIVNSDGKGQGYSVPNPDAQVKLITNALNRAGIETNTISYIESQAVGSPLADKIEVSALNQIFGFNGQQKVAISSLKPNIGHLEAASGIAQLTKVLLQLKHQLLAPCITVGKSISDINFTQSSIHIQQELAPWKRPVLFDGETTREIPRRAGISSFGAGGANAHLVVEEYIESQTTPINVENPTSHLVLLSAQKPEQLKIYAQKLLAYLLESKLSLEIPIQLADIAYTLQVGREAFKYRLVIIATSVDTLIESLKAFLDGEKQSTVVEGIAIRENRDRSLSITQAATSMARNELESIAQKWSQGWNVDWSVYANGLEKRLSLPTYPFQGERYWLNIESSKTVAKPPIQPLATEKIENSQPMNNGHTSNLKTDAAFITTNQLTIDEHLIGYAVQDILLMLMTQTLSLRREDIDLEENLGDYGFDSISLTQFAHQISERFEIDFRATLFFEYSTIRSISEYLVGFHEKAVAAALNVTLTPSEATSNQPSPTLTATPPTPLSEAITDKNSTSLHVEGIAVIGMSGIFPGSPDLNAFWENLVQKRSLIKEIPEERFNWQTIYGDALREEGKTNSKWGGFIDNADRFDAAFFNISPREAQLMDPQQRLFLQTTWKAIEDAGYAPSSLSGSRTGVFVGVASHDYTQLIQQSKVDIDGQAATGNTHSILANRVSFFLNLRGPSEPIDTACSSSLVAIHRAVNSLQTGECEMAIAGGINLLLTPAGFLAFGKSGMLANDGCCKTFDDRADGYVRGEGVGVVILKPLEKALKDGDRIYGIIRGTAVNHGGKANSLTAPNATAQAEVISEAFEKAGISPDTISYIEAHGTGTALGDPVEINALKMAFNQSSSNQLLGSQNQNYCGLGTVKTNIGHLETAAGIAGLLKVLLSLKHKVQPGVVNFQQLNRNIQIEGSPFYIVTETQSWDRLRDRANQEIPRRAGISSFGFGGVNVHVVVEEFESLSNETLTQISSGSDKDEIIVLSAQNEERLEKSIEQMISYLEKTLYKDLAGNIDTPSLADMAYTLQLGRDAMEARFAVVCRSQQDLLEQLQNYQREKSNSVSCFIDNIVKHRDIVNLLNEDPDHQTYIGQAIKQGQLHKLAALWVKGFNVDWKALHTDLRRRLPLPTYPFAETRHWITDRKSVLSVAALVEDNIVPPTNNKSTQTNSEVPSTNNKLTPTNYQSSATKSIEIPSPCASLPNGEPKIKNEIAQMIVYSNSSNIVTLETLQAQIRQIFAEFLSLDPAIMSNTQDFMGYGVDSIAGLRIMQRIQDRFGEDIPMLAIVEHPNFDRFSRYIFDNHLTSDRLLSHSSDLSHSAASVPSQIITSKPDPVSIQSASVVNNQLKSPADHSPLIAFQPNGNQSPLIGIHANTGEVSWLIPLVLQRGVEHPSYGLEAACFKQEYEPYRTIEAMAYRYAEEIIASKLQTPIILIGYGIGAAIAFEMANHLHKHRQQVSHLYLLDPYLSTTELSKSWIESLEKNSIFRQTVIANTLGAMWNTQNILRYEQIAQAQDPIQEITKFLLHQADCPIVPEKLVSWVDRSTVGLQVLAEALQKYRPNPYQGEAEVTIVQSQLNFMRSDNEYGLPPCVTESADFAQAWQPYVPKTFRIHEFSRDHFQILQPNNLRQLYQRVTAPGGRSGSIAEKGGSFIQLHTKEQWIPNAVSINKKGSQPTSFWIHTLLGDVSYGVNLSHSLGIDYPVFGLEQFDLAGGVHLIPNFEDMVAAYVQGIKRVQPQGPYILGGYSFGGVVAYEMARQLIETGYNVSHVFMIDSFMPNTDVFNSIDTKAIGDVDFSIMALLQIGNNLGNRWKATRYILLDEITGHDLESQIRIVAQQLYENSETLLDYRDIHRLVDSTHQTIMKNNDALLSYRPKNMPAATKILLFHATLGFVAADNANNVPEVKVLIDDRSNGFAPFVEGMLDIFDVPADHYTICNDEFIKVIASSIKQFVQQTARR
ncbi:hypothetical protein A6S26_33175 [Nostoc sp. ATCC 43529]|nr:hypothetical protein A6S26_33175 [Nostoc sp. ATCC 43529]